MKTAWTDHLCCMVSHACPLLQQATAAQTASPIMQHPTPHFAKLSARKAAGCTSPGSDILHVKHCLLWVQPALPAAGPAREKGFKGYACMYNMLSFCKGLSLG